MSVADVQKVHIVAHAGLKKNFIDSLQEEGLLQIEKADSENLGLSTPFAEVTTVERDLHRLSHALDYLLQWEEKGFREKLFAPKPKVSNKEREEILCQDFVPLLDRIEDCEKEKDDIDSHLRFLEKEEEFLRPLLNLELPIKLVADTDTTEVVMGVMPLASFKELSAETDDDVFWSHVISRGNRTVHLLLVYPKSQKERYRQILKDNHFNPLYFTETMLKKAGEQGDVKGLIQALSEEKSLAGRKRVLLDNRGKELASSREQLMRIHDVLLNEREKRLSSRYLGETSRAFFLEGWIKTDDIPRLEAKLLPFSRLVQCYFRPPLPEEDPPVILDNPRIGKPFEIITKLYGLPQRGTLDPTMYLAPFFFLFVGLTVSEAGYGLLVALTSFLFLKFAKPRGGARQFLILMALLGVATIILGTLVGGWFGFPIRKLMILDPLKDPVSFLILSLALGFIQVWFGTFMSMIIRIKSKDYLQGIFVQGGWLILLPSLVLYALMKQSFWGILAIGGAAGIVFFAAPSRNPLARFFGGLYSLYDISRYLADVLSYSRLLALGLATSVIAMVVNTLCQTALDIPWVGWLFAALIFVGGHLFNLGISFLGGFVHSMRLQFVEFFSKFFKSGGKPFKPFALESKYVEFIQ
jgi:V/A-type H+-transporting ATPase subunit I